MISVIVVDWNNLDFTKACLKSLYATTYKDKEIIVIDNGSGGKARKFYFDEQSEKRITFFDNYYNKGLAAAQNQGARLARGEWLFFLNNDTLVKRDIFEQLLTGKTDVRGCKMFDYRGRRELDSGISLDMFGCPAGKTGPVFYPDAAIMIKRSLFNKIGGFDEKLFLYGEDRDLCWRAWLGGSSVSIVPSAVFYHNSSCVRDTTYYRRYHSEKNIIRSMLKNYKVKSLFKVLPLYAFWSMLELGLILITKPKALFESYFPAYWWNIKNLKDTIKQRKYVIHKTKDTHLPFSKEIGKFFVLRTMGVPKWK